MAIHYFKEDIKIDLRKLAFLKKWLITIADSHGKSIDNISYILCSDEYLHRINLEYLQHDTYTDIITFDNRENQEEAIEADIFISVERVAENAKNISAEFNNELARVMVHGLLHLLGYKDKTSKDKENMRAAEDTALALI